MNQLLTIIENLGELGRLIHASKGQYHYDNPNHFVIFNANLCIDGKKVWYGDIDITLETEKLVNISIALKKDLYILYEMSARFENEDSHKIEDYAVKVSGSKIESSKSLEPYLIIKEGQIVLKSAQKIKSKPTHTNYNKEDFQLIGQIPNDKELIGKGRLETKQPYYNFYSKLAKKLGVASIKDLTCADVFVTKAVARKLERLTRDWLKKYHKLEGYKLQKELMWISLDIGPSTFQITKKPSWLNSNSVYLRIRND